MNGWQQSAVTLAVWIRGRCGTKDVAPYWVSQLLAGIVAALVRAYAVPMNGKAAVEIGRAMTDSRGQYELFLAGVPH